jgi:hypothetical protein
VDAAVRVKGQVVGAAEPLALPAVGQDADRADRPPLTSPGASLTPDAVASMPTGPKWFLAAAGTGP